MTQPASSFETPTNIVQELGLRAKIAASELVRVQTADINQALMCLADLIDADHSALIKANAQDVEAAKAKGLEAAMIDRLMLDETRLKAIAQSVRDIAALPDPTGRILSETKRPNGLLIKKIAVPIGVLGMIYESRPNVTVDAAALCLKSHNAVILRGGSESFHSSQALYALIQKALNEAGLPKAAVQMIPDTDRAHVRDMLAAHEVIDVMIPRGGKGLTSLVMAEAKMPVFAHLDGNCHIYVDESADLNIARDVVFNAKLRRTGICGAAESLLFHESLSDETILSILTPLMNEGCLIKGDGRAQTLHNDIAPADETDWHREYLDKVISVKFTPDVQTAAAHINQYGSHHTDCIISENSENTAYFLQSVDSAIVMHNASTQFADGGEFGFGAEIGIGTGKLHARGPVGLEQLTTFKYHVMGKGQTRD